MVLLSNNTAPKKPTAPAVNKKEGRFVGAAIEWSLLLFLICLVYKIGSIGIGALALISGLGFFNKGVSPHPLSAPSLFGILYVLIATVSAFQVSTYQGVYFTSLGFLVLVSGFVVSAHFSKLSQEQQDSFIRNLTLLSLCIAFHVIIYHVMMGRFTGWKLLLDTKFIFSLLPILFFLQEDKIKKRFSRALWWASLAGLAVFILLSGERKALVLLVCLFLISNTRLLTKICVSICAIALLSSFLLFSENDYIKSHVSSLFETHDDKTMQELSSRKEIVFDSDLIREFVNRNAIQQFWENPAFGLGSTGYQVWALKKFNGITLRDDESVQQEVKRVLANGGILSLGFAMPIHGEIYRIPAENGLLGIFVSVSYLLSIARAIYKYRRERKSAPSSSQNKTPLYLFSFIIFYLSTESINALMLVIILFFGFYIAALKNPVRRLSKQVRAPSYRQSALNKPIGREST